MIRAEVDTSETVIVADLPRGSVIYVDRDWLPSSSGEVPALVATPDGAIAWCGGPSTQMPGTADSDAAAAVALLSVARAAVTPLEGAARDSIEVAGSGLIARQVRTLLGDGSSDGRRREQRTAIIETTGDPSLIVDATRRLADGGTLVLVGEPLGREAEMNLYPDVHVRGLTLVGIPPPLQGDCPQGMTEADSAFVESARRLLESVSSGTPLSPDAPWYRVQR